jgi:hypothetical protein
VPHIAVKREFGGKKRGAQLRNELLGRIGRLHSQWKAEYFYLQKSFRGQ